MYSSPFLQKYPWKKVNTLLHTPLSLPRSSVTKWAPCCVCRQFIDWFPLYSISMKGISAAGTEISEDMYTSKANRAKYQKTISKNFSAPAPCGIRKKCYANLVLQFYNSTAGEHELRCFLLCFALSCLFCLFVRWICLRLCFVSVLAVFTAKKMAIKSANRCKFNVCILRKTSTRMGRNVVVYVLVVLVVSVRKTNEVC